MIQRNTNFSELPHIQVGVPFMDEKNYVRLILYGIMSLVINIYIARNSDRVVITA